MRRHDFLRHGHETPELASGHVLRSARDKKAESIQPRRLRKESGL